MVSQIKVGDIPVDLVLKDIKNVHLSVYPPTGRVRISAPKRMNIDTIRVFAISKLDWIKRHQMRIREQERESRREYLDRETHYVWGKRLLLKVIEEDVAPDVQLGHRTLVLRVRPATTNQTREAIVAGWYRQILKTAAQPLIEIWEPRLSVKVNRIFVQHMKTRWGTCNPIAHTIRLNTELAKKPTECLEYIVVHEMVHLLEPTHSARFTGLLDHFMPQWRHYRDTLNELPVRQERWSY
jgi:predicted metal-dependent hydrolase